MNPEQIQPGWVAPGGKYELANPPELGWVARTAVSDLVTTDPADSESVTNPQVIDLEAPHLTKDVMDEIRDAA